MKRQRLFVATLLLTSVIGCAASSPPDVVERVEPWRDEPRGQVLVTRHFAIHTTLDDPQRVRELAAAMEAAIRRFDELTGLGPATAADAAAGDRSRDVYPQRLPIVVFATRREWESYTRRELPEQAADYLRIHRGGYTAGDRAVLYDIGRSSTLGVAVHEAWHQYCARHLRNRLPPAIEEGIASRFEHVRLAKGRVELVESPSPARINAVRSMLRENRLLPLRRLLEMHAGDVLGSSRGRVEAFYAQSWALAEFLLRGDDGRHAESLRRMFADLANESARDEPWSPERSAAWFDRYFGEPERLDPVFHRFLVTLTR